MTSFKKIFIFMFSILLVSLLTQPAAAKSLGINSVGVYNTGDETSRTKELEIVATDFQDVNGVVFTLTYDPSVFEFIELVQADKPIDNSDHAGEDPQPTAEEIAATIYYQANNLADQGRVLIAAAGANYFASEEGQYVLFKAKMRVKQFMGSGSYDIGLQQTIIGPETALNAGYTQNVQLPVAAGLAPNADPSTAQVFPVAFESGAIKVFGGYKISGTVQYGQPSGESPTNVEVQLFQKTGTTYSYITDTRTENGAYGFKDQPAGTYRVKVNSLKPGYQRTAFSEDFSLDGETSTITVAGITLAAYQPLTGSVTLNGGHVPGLKVKVVQRSDGSVIGYFNVDANGSFVTTALPGTAADYDLYAVYGGVESAQPMGEYPYDFELATQTLNVSIECMTGKSYLVNVVQSDNKLEKTVSGVASSDPESVAIDNLIVGKEYVVAVVGEGIPVTFHDNDATPPQTVDFNDSDLVAVQAGSVQTIAFTFCNQESFTISGNVTKNNVGQKAAVFAISSDYSNFYIASSNDDGSYSLDVSPGQYMVYTPFEGSVFYYVSDSESTEKLGETVLVDGTQNQANINLILDKDETVAYFYGKVTEKRADGAGVPKVVVTAENENRMVVTQTDEKGEFRLDGFKEQQGLTTRIALPFEPGHEQVLEAKNDGTQVNFILNQGYTVSGHVQVEDDDANRVEGATVRLYDANHKAANLPVTSQTTTGQFVIKDVTAGIYTIMAAHPKYKQYKEEGVDVQGDKSLIIKMVAGAAIQGAITTDNNAALEQATVIVAGLGKKPQVTFSDDQGGYKVEGLENGESYLVMAKKNNYESKLAHNVTADNAVTVQDFNLPKIVTSYTVSGAVTVNNQPVADTTKVTLYSVTLDVFKSTYTSNGAYSFAGILDGNDYVLVIERPGKPTVNESLVVSGGNVTKDVNIVPTTISGTITLANDTGGKTVTVYLVNQSNIVIQSMDASESATPGTYTYVFNDVPAGLSCKVAAFSEGYTVEWFNGKTDFASADDVAAGDTADFTLELNQ